MSADRKLAEIVAEGRRLIAEATDREAKGFPSPLPWYVSGRHNMIWGDDGDAITGPEPYFELSVANIIVLAVNALAALLDVAEAAAAVQPAMQCYRDSGGYHPYRALLDKHDALDAALSALGLVTDGEGKEKSNG